MKTSDQKLIEIYSRTGSVWKTGEEVGMCGQSVHERLTKLGVIKHLNYWFPSDDAVLLEKYEQYKHDNRLEELAKELGRTKQFICRKARLLGLTDKSNVNISDKTRAKISLSTKKRINEHGHPRGFLGHHHGESARRRISESSHRAWANPNSKLNSEHNRQVHSDRLHEIKMRGGINTYSSRGNHETVIGGKNYVFKSSWEKEIANRLQSLKDDGSITGWGYEKKHFNFDDVKRGIRSYCPDFEVSLNDGGKMYIEVKGWKMPSSMKRIEMFRERYPNIKLYMIDEREYKKVISESDHLRRCCV
jgi:hypothetical protein